MQHEPRQTEGVSPEQAGGTEVPPVDGAPAPEPLGTERPAAGAPGADGGDAPEAVEQDLAELQVRAAQRDEFLALAQRTQADFDNFRRRAQREQQAAEQRGLARVVRELLPALDNLERALAAAEAQPDGAEHHLAEGIRLVQAELTAAMSRVGVEGYSPKGERFDPNVHEAMAQRPIEGAESGTIVEVYQSGYRLSNSATVIRPARVVVAA